jgi:low affinity Fe/Cu permease
MGKIKNIYVFTEKIFERLVSLVTSILGNSITFILAFCLVLFWWVNNLFTTRDVHQIVGDIIFGTTFLSLFIIQKSFNRFSGSLHLKVNELVSSHEPAKNSVINSEVKTEREITELSKEYTVLAGQVKELENKIEKDKSTK